MNSHHTFTRLPRGKVGGSRVTGSPLFMLMGTYKDSVYMPNSPALRHRAVALQISQSLYSKALAEGSLLRETYRQKLVKNGSQCKGK